MLHIAVAGAGIGGLVAALAIAKTGARVTVFERRDAPAEYGAGLQLSPNATRILLRLDLLDKLRPLALEPRSVRVRRGRDAAEIVSFPLGNHAVECYGAPFLLVLGQSFSAFWSDWPRRNRLSSFASRSKYAARRYALGVVRPSRLRRD